MGIKSLFRRTWRTGRYNYLKILRLKASPHEIAMGFALGVFVGLLPIIPFQVLTVILLSFLLRANKLAAIIGTFPTNPVTLVPFYTFFYMVGRTIVPFQVNAEFDPKQIEMMQLYKQGISYFATMFVGGLVLAIPLAYVSYKVVYYIVARYQRRKAERVRKKQLQLEEIRRQQQELINLEHKDLS